MRLWKRDKWKRIVNQKYIRALFMRSRPLLPHTIYITNKLWPRCGGPLVEIKRAIVNISDAGRNHRCSIISRRMTAVMSIMEICGLEISVCLNFYVDGRKIWNLIKILIGLFCFLIVVLIFLWWTENRIGI